MDEYLKRIYYDVKHPGSYSSAPKLLKAARADGRKDVKLKDILLWLRGQDAHTLHKPVRYNYPRNRVIVDGIDHQWDVDLMDMINLSKYNDGYGYVLIAIDVFSRYAWTVLLKTKRSKDVKEGIEELFSQGRKPDLFRTDPGGEFVNKTLEKYLKDQDVVHVVTTSDKKANYVERLIRTLKAKMFRYFTQKQTYKYVDVMHDLVDSYNNTFHRTIKTAPALVNSDNEEMLWKRQYVIPHLRKPPTKKFKLGVGDTVRISHTRHPFTRDYKERWTGEVFKIASRRMRDGLPIYVLKDWNGDAIKGTFYQEELEKVTVDENTAYKIEKVLKKRKVRGREQLLVRWLHWPKKFDSWIPASEIQDYQSL